MWPLLWKDFRIELQTKEGLSSLFLMALLILLVFSFALDPERAEGLSPALLWVTIIFSGLLGIQRSFLIERERGCLTGLLLCPVERGTIFIAKMVANFLFITITQLAVLPLAALFFHLALAPTLFALLPILLLGSLGFSALGTLFAAISVRTRAREIMLPLLLLPLMVPLIIAAGKATAMVFAGKGLADAGVWLRILLAFDAIFVLAGWMLFEYVVQE